MFIPQDLENAIVIYHGAKDTLVLEKSVKKLIRLLRERNCRPKFIQIADADHNSVFSDFENLPKVLRSLFGDTDNWKSEIRKGGRRRGGLQPPGVAGNKRSTDCKIRSMPHLPQHQKLNKQESSIKLRSRSRSKERRRNYSHTNK